MTTLMEMVQEAHSLVQEVPPRAVADELEQAADVLVVDVREPGEFARGHIPGAVNIPRGMLELKAEPASSVADPDLIGRRDGRIFLYCLRAPSARSVLAAGTLARMGYRQAAAIQGGLLAWRDQGLPVESEAVG